MSNKLTVEDVKNYRLEKWVEIFGGIYKEADINRSASSLWLDVIEESSLVAEFIRRDEYNKAIDIISNILCRLLCFIAKYSENVTKQVISTEGIDLRSKNGNGLFVTEWVLKKYPGLCSVCAKKPCNCPSSRAEKEKRNEDIGVKDNNDDKIIRLQEKYKAFNNSIYKEINTYTVEKLFDLFYEIYSGVQYDPPISSICFHFLEEVGEVSKLLLSFDNIQILKENRSSINYHKSLRYLHDNLKEEISDVISWIMALVNKINFILRSTYPHYHCIVVGKAKERLFKPITISQLLFNKFYNEKKVRFICPYCGSDKCTPSCNKMRLISEIEQKADEHSKMLSEVRQVLGPIIDNRICGREKVNIVTDLDNQKIQIVNMGDYNLGFLCNNNFLLNDKKSITIDQNDITEKIEFRITRPALADHNTTGYQFYYGAEIFALEKLPDELTTN